MSTNRQNPADAGYVTAQQVITAQADAGMTAPQIEACEHGHGVCLRRPAQAEAEAAFTPAELAQTAIVCDGCYQVIMG
jgi:hypothetical protein